MHSIEFIRNHSKEFDQILARRGVVNASKEILAADELRRKLTTELQSLQKLKNEKSSAVAHLKNKTGDEFDSLKEQVKNIKKNIESVQQKEREAIEIFDDLLKKLPNLLAVDVPSGNADDDNRVISTHGTTRQFSFKPKAHFDLGENLGLMDFVQTAKISGSRFVTLKGDLAKLERALGHFMLDIHTKESGFQEVSPPLLVLPKSMYAAGQLPKFAEDSFVTTNNMWLVPTAEVSLVNLVADNIIKEDILPIRYASFNANFRSEAGSAGKDTRGMIRQHQFYKVELVVICTKAQYVEEYRNLMTSAQKVLERLELPFRKVLKCEGDTGFHAEKSYDFEVWLPSQNCYREISSCSICGQFQARRMRTRYRKNDDNELEHPFTMNGTGVAVGRALVAILENYQEEDGSIAIPKVLHNYMGGQKFISKQ
ncbi:MAG: serine--tRNA ligase [Rickettsiales bacterium]|nr:serine--tRNA ligase [Rickettsiales bacterium]